VTARYAVFRIEEPDSNDVLYTHDPQLASDVAALLSGCAPVSPDGGRESEHLEPVAFRFRASGTTTWHLTSSTTGLGGHWIEPPYLHPPARQEASGDGLREAAEGLCHALSSLRSSVEVEPHYGQAVEVGYAAFEAVCDAGLRLRSALDAAPSAPGMSEESDELPPPPTGNPDAQAWAQSFVAHAKRHSFAPDEGVMIGWFANAMETAVVAAAARRAEGSASSPLPVEPLSEEVRELIDVAQNASCEMERFRYTHPGIVSTINRIDSALAALEHRADAEAGEVRDAD
jgi:hypothetical protein